jgi:hypothetical protein
MHRMQHRRRFETIGNRLAQAHAMAYNQLTANTFDVWRWQALDTTLLLMLQRCRNAPEQSFGAVLAELTRNFARTGITDKEPMRLVGSETKGFYLYESVYRELLTALKKKGYDKADPYAALVKYKNDENVWGTVNVNQILLLRLIGLGGSRAAETE